MATPHQNYLSMLRALPVTDDTTDDEALLQVYTALSLLTDDPNFTFAPAPAPAPAPATHEDFFWLGVHLAMQAMASAPRRCEHLTHSLAVCEELYGQVLRARGHGE